MADSRGRVPDLVTRIAERTGEIVDALRSLDEEDLCGRSELEGWSRLTIACHLRYGAEALRRMTLAAVDGLTTSYYPSGRHRSRPATLVPAPEESPSAVVESLALRSRELHRVWATLSDTDWETVVREPADNPDLGPLPLGRMVIARLTEVEVHGSDLGLGLPGWSHLFVRTALPFRLDRLNVGCTNHREFDDRLRGSWLLVASDGPTYLVSVAGSAVRCAPAERDARAAATAVIGGTSRDLLALLLGRPAIDGLEVSGDVVFGAAFRQAFPGP